MNRSEGLKVRRRQGRRALPGADLVVVVQVQGLGADGAAAGGRSGQVRQGLAAGAGGVGVGQGDEHVVHGVVGHVVNFCVDLLVLIATSERSKRGTLKGQGISRKEIRAEIKLWLNAAQCDRD